MSTSPSLQNARLPESATPRPPKRNRTNLSGQPLPIDRLLETLDANSLRKIISKLRNNHGSSMEAEIRSLAERPSIPSTLQVLREYQHALTTAFPLGDDPSSPYSYNRVQGPLRKLIDALGDFTPQFLPPLETQTATSAAYLDAVMDIIHELPRFHPSVQDRSKDDAYEDIATAWACVVRAEAKRAGGFRLQLGSLEDRLKRHNELSEGKLAKAVELMQSLGSMYTGRGLESERGQNSIRGQILSGVYGIGPRA